MTGVLSPFLHQEVLVLFESHKKYTSFMKKDDCLINVLEKAITSHGLSPFCCWDPWVDAVLERPPVTPQHTAEILSVVRFTASPPHKSNQIICEKNCLIQHSVNDRTSEWVGTHIPIYANKCFFGVDCFFFFFKLDIKERFTNYVLLLIVCLRNMEQFSWNPGE